MLVDSHCHLDFPDFDGELDDVVSRAHEAGIGHMLTICTRVTKFDAVRAGSSLAKRRGSWPRKIPRAWAPCFTCWRKPFVTWRS